MSDVEIPKSAAALHAKAVEHGWDAQILSTRGPDGRLEQTMVAQSAEEGGGSRRVTGDAKVIDLVVVKATRGVDVLWAAWVDGKFDTSARPRMLQTLSSTEASAHLAIPLDDHRFIPVSKTREVCANHGEGRERIAS